MRLALWLSVEKWAQKTGVTVRKKERNNVRKEKR
jgi:hypothetical protein